MNFTNTDCVKEEVGINLFCGFTLRYSEVRERVGWQVCWQVEEQVWEQVYLQVVRSFHQPMKIKIHQEIKNVIH